MSWRQKPAYWKRYEMDRLHGIPRGPVALAPVRLHIAALTAAGVPDAAIAEAARVTPRTIANIRSGVHVGSYRAVAARILAVTRDQALRRIKPTAFVPRLGARRRIEALHCLGWRHQDMTADAGVCTAKVMADHPYVTAAVHEAVAAMYDRLSMRLGPSTRTRLRAERSGFVPPLAWDDDAIDDPDARPAGRVDPARPPRRRVYLEDLTELAEGGATWSVAQSRLGVSRNSIEQSLQRSGRLEIGHRLSRNSEAEYSLSRRKDPA